MPQAGEFPAVLAKEDAIEFGNVRRNPALDAVLFRFEPPPGADVIGRAAP